MNTPNEGATDGVVTRYARAWERGDLEAIIGCYADDFVAHYGGTSAFAGTHSGLTAFLDVLMTTSIRAQRTLASIDQLHDNGDTGALFVTESVTIGETTTTVQRALRYRTANDRLVECWLYDMDQHVVDKAWQQA